MVMNRKQMWAAALAMSLAAVCTAEERSSRPRAAYRIASAVNDDLPPPPLPAQPGVEPTQVMPPLPPAPAVNGAIPPPARGDSTQVMPMPQPLVGGYQTPVDVSRWGMLPPPGTLGQTYQLRSALVDDDEHPRQGVVIVKLPEQADVAARGLKVKWTGEEWRLETAQPLLPGVPHIYAVKAEWDTPTGRVVQTRWVRLIMGRVVDLEF